MASIVRVRASKSETLTMVLCLQRHPMNGELSRNTKEETGPEFF